MKRLSRKGRWSLRCAAIAGLLVVGIFGVLARNHFAHAVLKEVSSDNWTISMSTAFDDYNNGDFGDYSEWHIPNTMTAYEATETKNVIFRVTYSNRNNPESYAPGELQIVVKNPLPYEDSNSQLRIYTDGVAFGVNTPGVDRYDWTLTNYSSWGYYNGDLIFTNANTIEANTNMEGSFDIVFSIHNMGTGDIPEFENEYNIHGAQVAHATLNDTITSNDAVFDFQRDFKVTWKKSTYNLTTTPEKIESYDLANEPDPENYTWVIYNYSGKANQLNNNSSYCHSSYPHVGRYTYGPWIGLSSYHFRTQLPEGVVAYDMEGNKLIPDDDGYVDIPIRTEKIPTCEEHTGTPTAYHGAILGYPKSTYNADAGTNVILHTVESRGVYSTETEESALAQNSTTIDLSEYGFVYDGHDVKVTKSFVPSSSSANSDIDYDLFSSDIKKGKATAEFSNAVSVMNVSGGYKLRFGDDVLFYQSGGTTQRLSENDYYFTRVGRPATVSGMNGGYFSPDTPYSLYVRYRGQDNFVKYGDYDALSNGWTNQYVKFGTYERVVAWYIEVDGLTSSIHDMEFRTTVAFDSQTLPDSGEAYNFNFVEIEHDGVITNTPDEESYAGGMTRDDIMQYDLDTYGRLRQHSFASVSWGPFALMEINHYTTPDSDVAVAPSYNAATDSFEGAVRIVAWAHDYTVDAVSDWSEIAGLFPEEKAHKYLRYYFLLPKGMVPTATSDEMVAAMTLSACTNSNSSTCAKVLDYKTGQRLLPNDEYVDYIKSHTSVAVLRNWHNTGQYLIRVNHDFTDNPYTSYNNCMGGGMGSVGFGWITVPYRVSYDDYEENGGAYTIYGFADAQGIDVYKDSWNHLVSNDFRDDGYGRRYDGAGAPVTSDDTEYRHIVDIDDDGDTDELLYMHKRTVNLVMASATVQDVQAAVKGDVDGVYMTNESMSSLGGNYSYRLRARSGSSQIKNVVLYDTIENAFGENDHWNGAFVGIDTSFADSQNDANGNPVHVKTYWSSSLNPDSLGVNAGEWQEYTDSTDKSQVRSLAFEFLDQNNQPATLPSDSNTYVLINMQAPDDNDISTYAYNKFHSEWKAIDPQTGGTAAEITGIDSNVTKINLDRLFDIHVVNRWVDRDDERGFRPDSVDFILNRNGVEDATHNLVTTSNNDSFDFEDLHLYDENHYAVPTPSVAHYATDVDYDAATRTYVFTHTLVDDTDFHVVHIWEDANNAYNLRPSSVDYTLRGGVEPIVRTGEPDGWTTDFLNLDHRYSYSLDDVTIENYTTTVAYNSETNTYTITSRLTKKFDVNIEQVWIDNNNSRNLRPESQEYTLKKTGADDSTRTITFAEASTTSFEDLPLIDRAKYSVPDIEIEHYSTEKVCTEGDDFALNCVFTSTLQDNLDIHVVQVWEDADNAYNLRPSTTSYGLVKDGTAIDIQNATANDWTTDFTNLHMPDKDQYSVTSTPIEDYTTRLDVSDDGLTYTFTSTLSKLFTVNIQQFWIDDNDARSLRPDSVDYILRKTGEADTVHAEYLSDGGTTIFDNLPLIDRAKFSVPDIEIEHYSTEKVCTDGGDFALNCVFTSTLQDNLDIHVVHEWVDAGLENYRPQNVTYTLQKNGSSIDTESSSSDTSWRTDFANLHMPDKSQYSVADVTVDNYSTVKTFDEETMTYTFVSTLNVPLEIHVKQVWVDNNNERNLRPASINYTLKKTGFDDTVQSINIANGDSTTDFTGLQMLDKALFSVSDVTVPHYSTVKTFDEETMTYTFTSTLIATEIHVKQVWIDNNNAKGLRPSATNYQLVHDSANVNTHQMNIANGESQFDFENIPAELTSDYSVTETAFDHYDTERTVSEDGLTYTFTSTLSDNFTITVNQVWVDNNNERNLRPESTSYTLMNNAASEATKSINAAANGSTQFTGLSLLNESNYSVPDITVEHYQTVKTYDASTHTYTFTSTLQDNLDIHIVQQWNDEGFESYRPESISYTLKKNDSDIASKTINIANGDSTTDFMNLHMPDKSQYSVADVTVDNYSTVKTFDEETMTYTFVSTLNVPLEIHVKQVWIDNDNRHNLRPATQSYTLKKTGAADMTQSINIANGDSTTDFTNLQLLDKSKYSMSDISIPHYSTVKTFDESTMTYTYTSTLSDTFVINIKQVWIDENNARNLRPASKEYTLKKTGAADATSVINFANASTTSFTDLSLLDEDKYSVPDITIAHYATTKSYDASTRTYTFMSTLQDNLDIHVRHVWVDNDNLKNFRPASYEYQLTKDGSNDSTSTASGSTNWETDFVNLHMPDKSKYAVSTPTIAHYETTVDFDAETMTYTFTSTLSDKYAITINQVWDDDNNVRNLRPEATSYTLQKSGSTVETKDINASANGSTNFTDLPLIDEAKYSVPEITVEHYATTVSYDAATHTYTFTSVLQDNLDIQIIHIWDDGDDHFELRPEKVDYKLLKNDTEVDSKEVSDDNDWQTKVTNLHMPDKSQYSVPTPDIENYTTTAEFDPDTMTYTFTSVLDLVPVNIKHVWDDGDNELESRPDEVNSELTRNDETEATHDVDTEENEDEFTIAQIPPVLLDEYIAKLSPIDYYNTEVEYDPDTNTYIFVSSLKPTEIHVRNIWVDNSDEQHLRPDTLEFNLRYAETQEASRSIDTEADDDSFTFEDLLEFKAKDYDVVLAEAVDGYETAVEFDRNTKTYVFTHTIKTSENPEDGENGGNGEGDSDDSIDSPNTPNTFATNPIVLILALLGSGSVAATTIAVAKRRQ